MIQFTIEKHGAVLIRSTNKIKDQRTLIYFLSVLRNHGYKVLAMKKI